MRERILNELISVDNAIALASQTLELLSRKILSVSERSIIEDAVGLPIAMDVKSPLCSPRYPRSSLDGCAVRSGMVSKGSKLKIASRSRPGGEPAKLESPENTCVWVDTGAPIPVGSDSVVPLEELEINGEDVILLSEPAPWRGVSMPCSDVTRGQMLAWRGDPITVESAASLRSIGYREVDVGRRLRACIASIGDELEDPPACSKRGKVCESNRLIMKSRLLALGVDVYDMGIVRDDPSEINRLFEESNKRGCDMLLTSGGSSVGLSDYIPVSEPQLVFRGVSVRPGRPTSLYVREGLPVFSLPGNPRSALTSLRLIVEPSLAHARLPVMGEFRARATFIGHIKPAKRDQHVPVVLVRCGLKALAIPIALESFMVVSWAVADGYVLASSGTSINPGQEVEVIGFRGPRPEFLVDFTESGLGELLAKPYISGPSSLSIIHFKQVPEDCENLMIAAPRLAARQYLSHMNIIRSWMESVSLVGRKNCATNYTAVPDVILHSELANVIPRKGSLLRVPNFQAAARLVEDGYVCNALLKSEDAQKLNNTYDIFEIIDSHSFEAVLLS
ncbi:MAG: molybdopterin molybdotransferase MoeA [Aeropyrum sp.]|nr:molybdopterin molybdotransferase MoeA [Aeropyrum sp.]